MERLETSHAVGTTVPPLIEEPIGRYLGRVAARLANHEALVSRHQGVGTRVQQAETSFWIAELTRA